MAQKYELKRYAAYFKGWCQAFGEHDSVPGEDPGIHWLEAENQIGFILPPQQIRPLYREVLRQHDLPELAITRDSARIGAFFVALSWRSDKPVLDSIRRILEPGDGGHLFLTSHFVYGTGARIITLSCNKPLAIIYKEIGPMQLTLT